MRSAVADPGTEPSGPRQRSCALFRCVARCASLACALCAVLLATWQGVEPCGVCFGNRCGDVIGRVCEQWFEWRSDWRYAWQSIWMGAPVAAILVLPLAGRTSHGTVAACVHVINVAWLLLTSVLLIAVHLQASREGSFVAGFSAHMGSATGRFCYMDMTLLLLTVGRCSAWLEKVGASYPSAVSVHRIAGWWCVAQVVLHSAFFLWYFIDRDPADILSTLFPIARSGTRSSYKFNRLGTFNFLGILGTIAALVLAVSSIERVRRTRFGTFYSTHLVASFAFVFLGALHDVGVLLSIVPACSYFIDRACAYVSSRKKRRGRLTLLHPAVDVVRLMITDEPLPSCYALEPGSRWLYVKIPIVSSEWHPFSVSCLHNTTVMHIKALGDWSQSLLEGARRQSEAEVDIYVEGLHGKPCTVAPSGVHHGASACPLSMHRLAPASCRRLLLVAGGVGIVPWADLLGAGSGAMGAWDAVELVWVVRGAQECVALEGSLGVLSMASRAGVRSHVHVTGARAVAGEGPEDLGLGEPAATPASAPGIGDSSPLPQLARDASSRAGNGWPPSAAAWQLWAAAAFAPGLALLASGHINDWLTSWPMYRRSSSGYLFVKFCNVVVVNAAWVAPALLMACVAWMAWKARALVAGRLKRDPRVLRVEEGGELRSPIASSGVGAAPLGCEGVESGGLQEENSRGWSEYAFGRPSFEEYVEGIGAGADLLVRACGSRSMMESVASAVQSAKAKGKRVTLELEEAEW
mmetsp:Transcript_16386/g.48017  ORF Transcript_16386/g.48017 Transcript_16386/m.48017 type:complete len:750 (-) Transcript_16386:232-2481(-)